MLSKFDVPPVWSFICLLVSYLLSRFVPLLDLFSTMTTLLGVGFLLLGFGLIFWSARWFARKATTIHPHAKPTTLIIEGPYRVSRNPIYLGMVLILMGFVLYWGALSGFVMIPVLYLILTRRFILPEEAGLHRIFGVEAERYLAETRRWF